MLAEPDLAFDVRRVEHDPAIPADPVRVDAVVGREARPTLSAVSVEEIDPGQLVIGDDPSRPDSVLRQEPRHIARSPARRIEK